MSKFVMRTPMMQHRPKKNRVRALPSPELMKDMKRKMVLSYPYRLSVQLSALAEFQQMQQSASMKNEE